MTEIRNGSEFAIAGAPDIEDGSLATVVFGVNDGHAEIAYRIDRSADHPGSADGIITLAGVLGRWKIVSSRNGELAANIRVLKVERLTNG